MIPIITTIFIRETETNPAILPGILACLDTLPQPRILAVDAAPAEFLRAAAARGHRLCMPQSGRPPRMLWNLANALLSIRPPPTWIATIEQDVAVSEACFAAAVTMAETAPFAVGALGLCIDEFTGTAHDITAPQSTAPAEHASLTRLTRAQILTWQATLWRTSALLACNPFHAPPMDGSDIITCRRLRTLGFSAFYLTNIPARHYAYLSTRGFRENLFHQHARRRRRAPARSTAKSPFLDP